LLTLADKLMPIRADDALSLYNQVIPLIVEETNNNAYADAFKLIRKVERIMIIHQRSREFGDYLAELRVRFKAKRNFIKLLDGVGR
jgi:uncharacterized Zn finger protein